MNPFSSLPLALPGRTLRLFARYWLPLVVWYLLGRGLHDGLLEIAAHVNRHNAVLAFCVLATGILCMLVAFVFMFQTVQPDLPTIWSLRKREAEVDPTIKSPERRGAREQLRAVGHSLLPFLLVYAAWNLFEDDVRAMDYRTWEIDPITDNPERSEFTLWLAGAAVVAWLLVKLFEFITRRTRNPVTAMLAAVCEANWMFFAIFGLSKLGEGAKLYFTSTVAGQNFVDLRELVSAIGPVLPLRFHNVFDALFGLDFGWLGTYTEPLKDGILLPVAWLAIAGACYGREMEDVKGLVDSRRFARFTGHWERAPEVVKRYGRRFPPASFKEKYYPPFHALRLMVTAGLPAIFFFCICYSAVELGGSLLRQSITTAVGPHDPGLFWADVERILDVGMTTLREALRICLLAVTFDLALSRFTSARARAVGGSGDAARSAQTTGVPS